MYKGVIVEVEYDYRPGRFGSYPDSPPEPDELEIEAVYYHDRDITKLVNLDSVHSALSDQEPYNYDHL